MLHKHYIYYREASVSGTNAGKTKSDQSIRVLDWTAVVLLKGEVYMSDACAVPKRTNDRE